MTADWFTALGDARCGSCNVVIKAGTPLRKLRSGLLRCADCTKRLLNEDIPEHLRPREQESTDHA